jgi:hypothetical protein
MLNISNAKKELKESISFKIRVSVIEEFRKLTKTKGFSQTTMIENAMIMLIEEMKKAEDKK